MSDFSGPFDRRTTAIDRIADALCGPENPEDGTGNRITDSLERIATAVENGSGGGSSSSGIFTITIYADDVVDDGDENIVAFFKVDKTLREIIAAYNDPNCHIELVLETMKSFNSTLYDLHWIDHINTYTFFVPRNNHSVRLSEEGLFTTDTVTILSREAEQGLSGRIDDFQYYDCRFGDVSFSCEQDDSNYHCLFSVTSEIGISEVFTAGYDCSSLDSYPVLTFLDFPPVNSNPDS